MIIMAPLAFLISFPSHVLGLLAFLKHRNDESAYYYQIFTTIGRISEIVALYMRLLFFDQAAGQYPMGEHEWDGVDWFVKNYPLMWFTAHVTPALLESSIWLTITASASMAADRVFALWKPFVYKTTNHR